MERGFDEIVIMQEGGLHPRRLPVAEPQVSWEINAAGAFSAFVRADDLRAAGLWVDIKGRWVSYESEAGSWGGVITAQPTTNNVVEIIAEGNAALLRSHEIAGLGVVVGTPGGLAKQVLHAANVDGPTYITFGSIDETGEPMSLDLTGDAAFDLLPQIAQVGEVEWLVDANRVFALSRRLGKDRSASVRLVEDRQIVEHRVNDDIWSASLIEVDALDLSGNQSAPPPWFGVPVGIGARNPAVPSSLGQPLPTIATELTLANIDDCFRSFDLGDTIRVDLGSIGVCGRFRGLVRALDVTGRSMTVSGELLRDD